MMMTKRILARDRRMAAVHEAGHVVVARRLGLRISSAWIVPNERETAADEQTWSGRVQIESLQGVDQLSRRMVGVAGAVAEWVWWGGWIEDCESAWGPGADRRYKRLINWDSVGSMFGAVSQCETAKCPRAWSCGTNMALVLFRQFSDVASNHG
jgi:hypothetical protein